MHKLSCEYFTHKHKRCCSFLLRSHPLQPHMWACVLPVVTFVWHPAVVTQLNIAHTTICITAKCCSPSAVTSYTKALKKSTLCLTLFHWSFADVSSVCFQPVLLLHHRSGHTIEVLCFSCSLFYGFERFILLKCKVICDQILNAIKRHILVSIAF